MSALKTARLQLSLHHRAKANKPPNTILDQQLRTSKRRVLASGSTIKQLKQRKGHRKPHHPKTEPVHKEAQAGTSPFRCNRLVPNLVRLLL